MIGIVVKGAYGRDYKSGADAKQDWDNGLDFIILSENGVLMHTYCSTRDFKVGTTICIRFNKLKDLTIFTQGD